MIDVFSYMNTVMFMFDAVTKRITHEDDAH